MARRTQPRRRDIFPIGWQAGASLAPVNSEAPVASGLLTVGSVLSVTDGTWTNSPTGYAYQWKRDATNVGTNANAYTLVTADIGAMMSCSVTATNASGSGSAASNALGPVVAAPAVGGAALLVGETNGFATDFTYATDASRVAVKTAGVVVSSALDAFYSNAGTSPKQVFDVSGNVVWSPHNMYIQSATPATRTLTTVVGQNYTVTVTGSGSLTGSAGASGVATQVSPLTFTASSVSSTFTLAGSLTQVQMNRGAVATAYLATTATARNGLAIDYDPVTHASKGFLVELAGTNLLLNNAALSTQSVTVTAAAHTLSFFGTGTITLSGTSTAGPLVGTGASNRVSLTFTPTAGSLTCTVTGTVSRAQLETGTIATSQIPTFAATATRTADNYTFLLSAIPALGAEYSIYMRYSTPLITNGKNPFVLNNGTATEVSYFSTSTTTRLSVIDNSVVQATIIGPTLVANTPTSVAGRFKLNDCAMSVSGGAVGTDTVATMPTLTEARFGNDGAAATSTAVFNFEKLVIVTPSWNDATLIAKSAT